MAGPTPCRLCGRGFEKYGGAYHAYCRRCAAKADGEVGRVLSVPCRECGGEFSTRTRAAKYCSDACRTDAARRLNREHARRYMADPEKRAMAMARIRAQAASRRAGDGRGGKGRPRPRRQSGGHGTVCPPTRTAPPSRTLCRLCGRGFAPYGGKSRSYCKRCTAKADRAIGRVLSVKCKECGKAFSTKSRAVRYCSAPCRAEGGRRSARECGRRRMSDPETRAVSRARSRAHSAASRDRARRKLRRA